MKVSKNTIEQLTGISLPPVEELVPRINAQLGQVEEVIDLGSRYKDAKIVKVVRCEKHPDADKLSVCHVDVGAEDLVQVVCGAPNVHADMWAVWLPPQSVIPSTHGTDEEITLDARALRGVMSHGMLASARELGIGDDHAGIVDITDRDVPAGRSLLVGVSFAEVFGLDDTIIDIENKMFTHRPDLFGQMGVAREILAIFAPEHVGSPQDATQAIDAGWYMDTPVFSDADGLALEVYNHAPDTTPRFMAVALKDVKVQASPLWLRCELIRWGGKPVNNIVDLTNYLMLLTAQPVHAYDYDKLRGGTLGVRMAERDETLTLLNGKTYTLHEDDIVIADGSGAVGLAGIMGGAESEVTAETTSIVLEVATFDMYTLRRTSMRHGLFTDALTRFNKGQSPRQNDRVMGRLMGLLGEQVDAVQASPVFDQAGATVASTDALSLDVEFINQRLGLELTADAINGLLSRAEFTIKLDGTVLHIEAPFWRTDISLPEDIVEEVGRLYGYDRLPRKLPLRSARPAPRNAERELALEIRKSLASAGGNEVLTYSFVHEKTLTASGQEVADAYALNNALSPDLQFYRLSVTPSILEKVYANIRSGYSEIALFEIGKSHSKKAGVDESGLPFEPGRVALVYAAKTPQDGAAYYRVRRLLDNLAKDLGLRLDYKPLAEAARLTAAAPFNPTRSARVVDMASGQAIGIIGEYAASTRKAFKVPEYSAGFELFSEGLAIARKGSTQQYESLSQYPSVERDVCFEVTSDILYRDVFAAVERQLKDVSEREHIEPVDI